MLFWTNSVYADNCVTNYRLVTEHEKLTMWLYILRLYFDPLDSVVLAFQSGYQSVTRFTRCQEVGMKGGLDR